MTCVDENVLSSSALETTVPTSNRWTALAQDSSGNAHGDEVSLESGPSPPAPSTISPALQPDDDASQQSNGWSTICAPKRTRVLFVGGLLSTTTTEQLTSYINRTARKKVNIFTCFVKEPGERRSTFARIKVDRSSASVLLSNGFWPGKGYCRPWHSNSSAQK